MLLAVAGLTEEQVKARTKILAGDDWSSFSPADRVAFAFAKKQAKTPWAIDAHDMDRLRKAFGEIRALDVLWWSCRCHYMTRVADAFQLPLETENVFMPPARPPGKESGTQQMKTPKSPDPEPKVRATNKRH